MNAQMTYLAGKILAHQLMKFVAAVEVAVVRIAASKVVVAVAVHMDRMLHTYYKREEPSHLNQGHHFGRTASCTYYIDSGRLQANSKKKMLVVVRYQ